MTISESYIYLREARFHARHGVFPQERTVGGDFTVSLRVKANAALAVDHDAVDVTVNYATLYDIVKHEMSIPSDLLEHVAGRIGRAIFERFPEVPSLQVSVTKVNPPMGADCEGVGVELHLTR